jgi:hypothetical protein
VFRRQAIGAQPDGMVGAYTVSAAGSPGLLHKSSTERIEGARGILTIRGDLDYSATLRFRQVPGALTTTPERHS